MFPKDLANVCVFYTLSPLHAGSGQAISAVDLPIQRERHTQWPHVQASGVKGAFRDWFYRYYQTNAPECSEVKQAKELTDKIFGKEEDGESGSGQAGAISVTDARILAFPVRSNVAPFVWVTCPAVLTRLQRDLILCPDVNGFKEIPSVNNGKYVSITGDIKNSVILEDLAVVSESSNISEIASLFASFAPQAAKRLLLISDQDFSFLVQTATEVKPQIRIDADTGTAKDGSLRYQEFLPSDSILYSLIFFAKERVSGSGFMADFIKKCVKTAISTHIQMGGDMTLGCGLMEVRWLPEFKEEVTI